ncbi:response regulator transcription factor [Streptomyces huiliensis]|uniref:response regulator transcription factor n=1 Tax=Streptomyces huiliensis TaxID=2876027 RepID=UPI001CBB27A5|nr:response regulator transcription factor [Streptomyces huiliensis]MBZ4319367.1 response regulator transcription factor [Streptomyces huiliensis]
MISVLLAEDEHLIRGALTVLLGEEFDLRVVADTGRGDEVLPLALEHQPDVAVLDVNLLDVSGLDVAEQLHRHVPSCRVMMLTSLGTPGTVRQAIERGVNGYLLKDAAPGALAEAIRKVAAGHRVIAPELMLAAWESRTNPLTPRETEILRWASEGRAVRDIAAAAQLSPGTVRNYLSSSIAKLGARSRLDAVRLAREAGWLIPAPGRAPSQDTSP